MAPEVIEKTPYGKSADLWSLGAVIYDLLVGEPPFYVPCKDRKVQNCLKTNRKATKYNILHCNYVTPALMSPEAKALINSLLRLDVDARLGGYDVNYEAVRGHAFFEAVNWKDVEAKKLIPPFVPDLQGPTDVSNFDEKHTQETKDNGLILEAEAAFNLEDAYVEHFDYTLPSLRCNNRKIRNI